MYSAINNNKLMGVIFVDIAKAFDCIDQQILYRKMCDAGFSVHVVDWFKSYFSRTQNAEFEMGSELEISPYLFNHH